jgi:hypothetical protein
MTLRASDGYLVPGQPAGAHVRLRCFKRRGILGRSRRVGPPGQPTLDTVQPAAVGVQGSISNGGGKPCRAAEPAFTSPMRQKGRKGSSAFSTVEPRRPKSPNVRGTGAKLAVRRQQRLAGMSRWLDGISVRIRHQAYHYRPRTEPEAVGRRRAMTSAFADFCSSGGSPRNWLSLL